MTRTVSFRSVWATTRTCPRVDAPIVRKRASASECTSSANVVDSGSSRTVAASWKLTRCLLRFAAAFAGSHSNCTARVYGPVPADHQTAERIGNELQAAALMESANRRDRSAAPRLASSISMLGTVALSCHPPALVNSEFDKRECLLEVLVIGGLSDLPCRIRTRGPGPINQRGPG